MLTAYLNGSFLPLEAASISVMDRGFLFGDHFAFHLRVTGLPVPANGVFVVLLLVVDETALVVDLGAKLA